MRMRIFQAVSFARKVGRYSAEEKHLIDQEIMRLARNPAAGDEKKGELGGVFIHRFRVLDSPHILAYQLIGDDLELIMVGPRVDYYRESKYSEELNRVWPE